MKLCNRTIAGLWVALALTAAGCSESAVESRGYVVPAGGTLTCKGSPVANARLTFLGDDASEPAFATTDAQGRFRCMTNDSSEGVRPGQYVVTVSSPKGGIPEKYGDAKSSPLRATIEDADANDLRLELED